MELNAWTLALQAVNFLVLVWLLARFLYRPVLAAIDERRAASQKLLDDAADALRRAEAREAEAAERKRQLAADTGRVRAEAAEAVARERERVLAAAGAEAQAIRSNAREAAEAELAARQRALEADAGVLATTIARLLLLRLPQAAVGDAMFEALLGQLREVGPEVLAGLAAGDTCTLVTPSALDPDRRERWSAALAAVLPQPCAIAFAEDAELLAGCELRAPHLTLRNSWRADLATIGHEIKRAVA